jgi:hypothetical protein
MGAVETELLSALFLLPDPIAIEALSPTQSHLTIQMRCILKSAACPLCQHPSERIHSSYSSNLPVAARSRGLPSTVPTSLVTLASRRKARIASTVKMIACARWIQNQGEEGQVGQHMDGETGQD